MLTFRKSTTKGKLKTRVGEIQPGLALIVSRVPASSWCVVSRNAGTCDPDSVDGHKILKAACDEGAARGKSRWLIRSLNSQLQANCPHQMSSAGIPLRHIQEISGHNGEITALFGGGLLWLVFNEDNEIFFLEDKNCSSRCSKALTQVKHILLSDSEAPLSVQYICSKFAATALRSNKAERLCTSHLSAWNLC